MKNQIEITSLKKENLTRFQKFIKYNHTSNHILSKSKKLLDWFYKNKKNYNFMIAYYKNDILGVQGFIPFSKFDIKLKETCFLSYWRVKSLKSPGVGLKLFNTIKDKNYNFLGVLGISNNLLDYHRWQGFKVGKLNHHFFLNRNLNKTKIINYLLHTKYLKRKFEILNINKNNINKINNKIFSYQFPKKSKEFIVGRYLNNNFYNYKIFYLKSSTIFIILVFRKIKIGQTNILKAVDLIGKNSDIKYIGNAIQNLLEKFKSEYLDLYSYGIKKEYLNLAGFTNRYNTKEIIPDHFEPYEKKNIDINFAYISRSKKKINLFKGYGDTDRPSKIK